MVVRYAPSAITIVVAEAVVGFGMKTGLEWCSSDVLPSSSLVLSLIDLLDLSVASLHCHCLLLSRILMLIATMPARKPHSSHNLAILVITLMAALIVTIGSLRCLRLDFFES